MYHYFALIHNKGNHLSLIKKRDETSSAFQDNNKIAQTETFHTRYLSIKASKVIDCEGKSKLFRKDAYTSLCIYVLKLTNKLISRIKTVFPLRSKCSPVSTNL